MSTGDWRDQRRITMPVGMADRMRMESQVTRVLEGADPLELFLESLSNAAEAVVEVLEAERGLKHQRHQDHLEPAQAAVRRVMYKYFGRQEEALLHVLLPQMRSHIEQFQESTPGYGFSVSLQDDHGVFREASKRTNGKLVANSILPNSVSPLRFAAVDSEDEAYSAAITSAIDGAAAVLRAEMLTNATPGPNFASNYLRSNSLSKLTGDIAETTKNRLRNAIADAWDAGGSFDQLAGAIKSTFADFSDYRVGMIAQTEVVTAYNAGRSATAVAAGFDEHAWETESGNPCAVCLGNEAQGWIPIDDAFESGDLGPTAHPNCECVENFRSSR